MKFFLLAASNSKTSINKKLIGAAAEFLRNAKHEIDLAELDEFDLPLYSANIQNEQGIPENATKFAERMHAADKIIFSSPEYNGSIPGPFKNLIDWVSRIRPMPWNEQDILLLSASPSIYGGMRGLIALRQPLEICGAYVFPKMHSLSNASDAFTETGTFADPKRAESFHEVLTNFATKCIVTA